MRRCRTPSPFPLSSACKVWATLVFLNICGGEAFGFPAALRTGRPACASCHYSPSGGGVMNAYGHEAGDGFLPTWSYDGEGASLWGATAANPTLQVGGDIRFLHVQRRKGGEFSEKKFLMQADLEPALEIGSLTMVGQFGLYQDRSFGVRRFYGLYRPPVKGLFVRAGRFIPNYGINTPNHTALIRDALGFGQGTEVEGVEVGMIRGFGEFFLHGFKGALREGGSARAGWYIAPTYHVGINGLWERVALDTYRTVTGLYGFLAPSDNFWILAETDWETNYDAFGYYSKGRGIGYLSFGHDVAAGWQAGITFQGVLSDRFDTVSRYSVGVAWIPRPHFELSIDYGLAKEGNKVSTSSLTIVHIWL